jgi:hypothetical protein
MARRPNIPYGAFGEGRIPRKLKQRFRKQSNRAARRIYGPEIQMLRGQRRGVRKQYQKDVQAAKGAINFTQSAINQVPLKGLSGRYRKEVAGELALASKDVAASFPALKAEARATRNEELSSVRDDILTARINKEKKAGETYNSLLSEARTDAEQYLKSRRTGSGSSGEGAKERKKEWNTAIYLAQQAIQSGVVPPGGKKPKKPWQFSAASDRDQAWGVIARAAAGEGVSPLVAGRAVEYLRKIAEGADQRTTSEIGSTTSPHLRRLLDRR